MTYSIGVDFGTGSGRVMIVDTNNGDILAMSVIDYRSGTIEQNLNGNPIPSSFALQDATDYIDVLKRGVPEALKEANINPNEIIGLGIDFTASTVVFADKDFTPLNEKEENKNNPHAYTKLWKHHGAEEEAKYIFNTAVKDKDRWLGYYGFNVSSEWLIPKLLEVKNHAPDMLEQATYIMEAGDWVISNLINENVRSNCGRGFKTFWNEDEGFFYDFYEKLDSELPDIVQDKLEGRLVKIGEQAGVLTDAFSEMLGLPEKLPVAPAIIDAHSGLLGIGSKKKNQLTMVMGTSTCHIMLHEKHVKIPGISGSVKDSIIPGLYAYEAGQSAVGDLFGYAVKQSPKEYTEEAEERGISIYELLEEKASQKEVGESGLVALDWHNGNRSVLSDSNLSGLLIGLTLHTKPEDIYRAYMEATAFGTKIIMASYEDWGMEVDDVFASGGLPQKSDLLIQIYADVLNRPITVSASDYASGVGAAILGAVAGDAHEDMDTTISKMKQPFLKTVEPIPENVEKYEKLFKIYNKLHDEFGFKHSYHVMKELKEIQENQETV
ncbi:ribulokinase [Oceanobacillus jeddahense]|uniref:ribulokinase n=1 Tax=Oceanobacillus jeddahense TaxID=1462527 RepID=UPI0005958C6B|nr:ribulokinase [Oceanobacillus jeddahense]